MSSEVYKKLGLSVEEGQIYTIMASKMVRTKEEIALLTEKLAPLQVENLLKSLEKKKFIRIIPGKVPQYHALVPPVAMSQEIDHQVETTTAEYKDEINSHWEQGQVTLQSIITQFQEGVKQLLAFKKETSSSLERFINQVDGTLKSEEERLEGEIEKNTQVHNDTIEICGHTFSLSLQSVLDKDMLNLTEEQRKIHSDFQDQLQDFINKITDEKKEEFSNKFEDWINQSIEEIEARIQPAQEQREEKLQASTEFVDKTGNEYEKTILEFSDQFPKLVEEFTARHSNDFNLLDRTFKGAMNKIKSRFVEIQDEVNNRLSKRVSLGKSGFEAVGKIVDLSIEEIDTSYKDIENQIENIIQSSEQNSSSLAETVTSNLNKQNLEFQHFLSEIKNDLAEVINNSYQNTISTLQSVSQRIRNSSLQQRITTYHQISQLSELLAERNTQYLTTIDQVLQTFFTQINIETQRLVDRIIQNVNDCLATIKNTLIESGTTYFEIIEKNLSTIFSSIDSEVGDLTTTLDNIQLNLETEINDSITDANNSISTNLNQSIEAIPDRFSKGLAQGQEIVNVLRDINTMALELPIEQIEHTYLQIESLEGITRILEAMLARTKSTIQIILPSISLLPIEAIKQITRPRIQILTQIKSSDNVQELSDIDNVHLKNLDDLGHVYAIARDGTEEISIGSGKDEKIPIIATIDEELAAVLKEIIQDYWPRGRAI
ncbi:MAG: hypothetical protein JSW11_15005 [Candidatus Heimdallarchaeota archaeon]|nr:MAG: hypothetical protein JSW11_15005 [Candidatus Heimdallarchaeota archaeon]